MVPYGPSDVCLFNVGAWLMVTGIFTVRPSTEGYMEK